ncbi:ATP-dependent DNA ligase [Chitinophagaceae bacterium IBVUCB2]|nr:ATP-dependent DNA ligase [Chitinophagaceae bacterium IBVUCB2]
MKLFAQLIYVLGATTKTNEKLKALQEYFAIANDKDKVWVIALFTGRRPKRVISSTLIKTWCAEYCNLPLWLFDECYHTVGDLSETIALLITGEENADTIDRPLHYYIESFIQLAKASEEEKKNFMLKSWEELGTVSGRFVFNKLLSGAFRIGVSQQLLIQALAKVTDLEKPVVAHRITGNWDPAVISFDELMNNSDMEADASRPYPFYLAYPLEDLPDTLGNTDEWQAEWKWDGIRGQLIKRSNTLFTWSRGEELVTEKFPEYNSLKDLLPEGIVLDGEIIPAIEGKPLPFAKMQTRIGRKNISKKILQEVPVCFFVYDILEFEGKDMRQIPLVDRRKLLEQITAAINHPALQISPVISFDTWDELAAIRVNSRENLAEGLMLKRKSSSYQTGRKIGDWWKWKIEPLVIDAVMIYAQKGSGRRSNLYTDYTFAVKDGEKLVSFAKAYSGLTDKEIAQVDNFVKRNSLEKFGPVRTVKPELVFELAFEGIAASSRHKSGVALRFPRINRWRKDKKPEDINTIDDLKNMLEVYGK